MLKNNAFSLIEVLVAAVILSVTIFWILRLTNNNSSNVWIIEKNKEILDIYENSKACFKSFWTAYLSTITWSESINFWTWNNICKTWSSNASLSFSWVKIDNYIWNTKVNPNEYFIYYSTKAISWWVRIYETIKTEWITKDFTFTQY